MKNFKILLFLFATCLTSNFMFAQTTVNLADQCNCEVFKSPTEVTAGDTAPAGADTGDLLVDPSGDIFYWDGTSWGTPSSAGIDTDDQTLSLSGTTLSIADGNSVNLGSIDTDTDDQTLSLSGNTLSIAGGNSVSLSSVDNQTLSVSGNTLTIAGGNAVSLAGIDNQTLSLSGNTLSIAGGNNVNLASFADDQTLSLSGTTLSIAGGNNVNLSSLNTDTDDQTLSLSGTTLSIADGNNVNLSGIDTDNQTLSLSGTTLSIAGGNNVNLGSIAAAAEPWFGTDDNAGATTNTESIYHMGKVAIGGNASVYDFAVFDTDGNNFTGIISQYDNSRYGVLQATPAASDLVLDQPGTSLRASVTPNGSADLRLTGVTSSSITLSSNAGVSGYNAVLYSINGRVSISGTTAPPVEMFHVFGNIRANGYVMANGTILTSDARLKKNVVAVENALATVADLRPVHYSKKETIASEDYNKVEYGFIAQEIQEILPELVTEGKGEDKLLAMDYNSIIPILTKAIQEQQAQIETLQTKNNTLSAQVSELENLKAEIADIKVMLKTAASTGTATSTEE